MQHLKLYDRNNAAQFYDDRYKGDYMDEWPLRKKKRVYQLIQELDLPEVGVALDFGCGTGVFTSVITQALPKWQICGTDLSALALSKAKEKNPNADFFTLDDPTLAFRKFDLIFSHHVLEHVSDIDETWLQFLQLCKPGTKMLHICPCGNQESFEYKLCKLRKNGLREYPKNTFFYEEPGHLRKLDTQQMRLLAAKYNFEVLLEYYAWHHYEAIEGITLEGASYVQYLTDPTQAVDDIAFNQLNRLNKQLHIITTLRMLSVISNHRQTKQNKSYKDYLLISILKPLGIFSWLTNSILEKLIAIEWHQRRKDPKGAEMYFLFEYSRYQFNPEKRLISEHQ